MANPNSSEETDSNSKVDLLSAFGLNGEEIDKIVQRTRVNKASRNICICGHAMARHNNLDETTISCFVSGMYCPCSQPIEVLVAIDTRLFMYQTTSIGSGHALSKGIRAADKANQKYIALIEPICFVCHRSEVPAMPTAFDRNDFPISRPGTRNGLVCEDCLHKLRYRSD
jgi:hypothetical protein